MPFSPLPTLLPPMEVVLVVGVELVLAGFAVEGGFVVVFGGIMIRSVLWLMMAR